MTTYDDLEMVTVAREGNLLVLSLNRPEARNAMNRALSHDFHTALERIADDEDARAVLIRGEGKSFCVGGDVKMFDEWANDPAAAAEGPSPAGRVEQTLRGSAVVDLLLALPQPTVAAVQGHAMGLGSTIALFCDVVVAAEDAKIADSHVNIGLVAGDGGAVSWPLAMPIGAAKWYLLTGDRLSGAEAERLGLVFKAVPEADLLDEAKTLAARLAELPPLAVRGTKATINKIIKHRMDLTLEFGLLYEGATYVSEDHAAATAAFVDKSTPVFKGR